MEPRAVCVRRARDVNEILMPTIRNLFSPSAFVAALLFGLGALATMAAGFSLAIPGTGMLVDSREIFVALGAALGGPLWGVLTGVLAGLHNPIGGITVYSVLQHAIRGLFMGAAYWYVFRRYRMPYLLLAWIALILLYYYVVSLPGLYVVASVDSDLVAGIVGRRLAPLEFILLQFRSTFVECLFTLGITTATMAVLPRKYRRPLWMPKEAVEEVESRHEKASQKGTRRGWTGWNRPLIASMAFGLGGSIVILAQLHFTIPGTNLLSDPREIFVYLGSALAGPLYAPLAGILASLPEPNPDIRLYVVIQHIIAAVWVAWTYRWLMRKPRSTVVFLASWCFIVFATYYIVYLPGFFILSGAFPETFSILVGKRTTALEILPVVVSGWIPEFVLTTLATAITLYILPSRYRIPLDLQRRIDQQAPLPGRRPRPTASNFLGFRLTLWFLVLSFVPLIVIGVFIRNDVAMEISAIQARQQQDLANVLAQELRLHSTADFAGIIHRIGGRRQQGLCIVDRYGTYRGHADTTYIGANISQDVGPETLKRILSLSRGPVIEPISGLAVGFAPVEGREEVVVAIGDPRLIAESLLSLEWQSYLKLSTSLILLSFAGGLVIWIVVVRPMGKLTWAAQQIGHGNLQATVDARDMDDEVGMLAHAFNEMTRNLRVVHEGLEGEIAQRSAAEAALREGERQFRLLAENATDMISRHDSRGRYLYVSPSCRALLGYEPDELIGRSAYEYVLPEDRSFVEQAHASSMANVEIPTVTYRLRRKDGGRCWVESTTRAIVGDDGAISELHVATRDINRRKAAEQALIESEERLRSVVTNSPVVLFAIDSNGTFTLSEGKGLEALGLRPGQVVGLSVHDVYRGSPKVVESIQRGLRGEPHVDILDVGNSVFETWVAPIVDASGWVTGIIGVATNVTERRRMESAIRESEAMYKTLVQQSNDAIYVLQDRRLVFVNRAWEEKFGYTMEDVSDPAFDFMRVVAPGSMALLRERFNTFHSGKMPAPRYEMQGVTKSGEILDFDVSVAEIEWRGQRAVQGVYRDITERKRSEEVILQKQKMESIGVLAGGVAHDFNNLLQAILGHIALSAKWTGPDSPALGNLKKAEMAAERAAELTRQLLAYSGRGKFDVRPLNVNGIITANLNLLSVAIHKTTRLDQELAPDLPVIMADAGQMQQVVMNLIINAAEAMGDKPGRILLRTEVCRMNSAEIGAWSQSGSMMEPGDFVLLEVTDEGSGMSQETARRIFEPFFTTKFTGRGLGLSAVLGIVRGHHGGIRVKSEVGKGTTFQLAFPVLSGGGAERTALA